MSMSLHLGPGGIPGHPRPPNASGQGQGKNGNESEEVLTTGSKPQELYVELMQIAWAELYQRAESGEELVKRWLERFLTLGDQLGVRRAGKGGPHATHVPVATAALVRETLQQRRVPRATYRLQFNRGFTFLDARDLVPYLSALGVSDCYASPVLQACTGSSHGYDICDHSRLNPELGGEQDFDSFSIALREHGMGLILDAVPNHMGIAEARNAWWMDVLENGPSSVYAPFFDIDWHPVNPDLENKVLLPLLEDQYGRVLEAGKIRLVFEEGAFVLCYYQIRLPVSPCTYPAILELRLADLIRTLGEDHEHLRELRSILTALRYLPGRTEVGGISAAKVVERNREKEVIKRRLAALCAASAEVRSALDATIQTFNGTLGDPRSYDLLDDLIDRQAYRPAFWRVATEEVNYRRFFDINELAAIRMELPEVFRATHQLLFRLLAQGKATGLRIDHPDGLRDPAGYFRQLQESYVLDRVRSTLQGDVARETEGLENLDHEVAAGFALHFGREPGASAGNPWPLYVVAEKILTEGEPLPPDWAVDGTTGYDFLNVVNGLFVAGENRETLDRIYHTVAGPVDYHQLVISTKKMIMLVAMASEINALAHQLDRIAERNRRYRDFTLNSLTFALREVIASLAVYRTYITGPGGIAPRDQKVIDEATDEAKRRNPRTPEAVFDFVRDALLLRCVGDFPEADRPKLVEWSLKFQQLTGPIMAKGVEDTVFYTYNRLVSLNEVGGAPDRFGVSLAAFHRQNIERLARWPHSLLATSTHDTKRSEDVRARLNVLSELPHEWAAAVERWREMNAGKKTIVEEQSAPDGNDEYLLYQTLLGIWPTGAASGTIAAAAEVSGVRERVTAYMLKATREAKVHTSWVNPNEEYDAAVRDFIQRVLPDTPDDPFLTDLLAFQHRVAFFGFFNSLSQVLLKLICPGVPDLYQGSELWDLSLVDPDNRRPVDYRQRREILAELQRRQAELGGFGADLTPLTRELLKCLPDGRIKLYVIYQALTCRRSFQTTFAQGGYLPLKTVGTRREHVCAFVRSLGNQAILVVVPRLVAQLLSGEEKLPLGPDVWGDTRLSLPQRLLARSYRNLFTGELIQPQEQQPAGSPGMSVATLLGQFPIALLTT
jgi:(1->4)-alpha-D-glucan 1-alpha-D-glucosylmutase